MHYTYLFGILELCIIWSLQSVSSFAVNLSPWAGSVIWWSVQGILQMRIYALYHCSKKLLVFMVIVFVGEVGTTVWMLISSNLSSHDTTSLLLISFPGYRETDLCLGAVSGVFAYIWVPRFVFESMLCLLAICAGIKHSRGRSWRSTKTTGSRLIDILVQGNVIYFISPLGMFILLCTVHNFGWLSSYPFDQRGSLQVSVGPVCF
ncbi:hypothetical protein SCLCIDRAFT_1140057 [Scleroderma citrinum Foug A]|uniref:Uncharacterized protein n=1 Tax=Scleroderma citrinum Foug A TaxID=1036808 RepID=A0A0C2ZXZ0_9AGAM|nr:hypothetical protein SCLCIDRAFT_1140057 [Scleroderma citrinum Foug A]